MNKIILASVALAAASTQAQGAVIDFEGPVGNYVHSTPIVRNGFTIAVTDTPAGSPPTFQESAPWSGRYGNGTRNIFVTANSNITLSAVTGDAFALTSFDIAGYRAVDTATTYAVRGYLDGVLVGTLTGVLGQFQTVGGFGAVDTVVFDGIGGSGKFTLDNIVTGEAIAAAVPEPASWAMMIAGFGLVGSAMRRRSMRFTVAI